MTDMSLADEVALTSRVWLRAHMDRLPDWNLRNCIEAAYPGGWVRFLVDYRFIREGEYEPNVYEEDAA